MLELSPQEWTAIRLSLRVAAGRPSAVFPQPHSSPTFSPEGASRKTLLDGLCHPPLVPPPVVTGLVLLLLFGRTGPLGAFLAENFGIIFSFRWTGAVLACAVMSFPLMMRAIRLQIEAIDRRLEAAAGTLGAGPVWTFFLVTLPLRYRGFSSARSSASPRRSGNSARDNHLRFEHPRRDLNDLLADLRLHSGPRRRRRRPAAGDRFIRDRVVGAARSSCCSAGRGRGSPTSNDRRRCRAATRQLFARRRI